MKIPWNAKIIIFWLDATRLLGVFSKFLKSNFFVRVAPKSVFLTTLYKLMFLLQFYEWKNSNTKLSPNLIKSRYNLGKLELGISYNF